MWERFSKFMNVRNVECVIALNVVMAVVQIALQKASVKLEKFGKSNNNIV